MARILLWLRLWLAAVAPIRLNLAWELPYAAKGEKKKKVDEEKENERRKIGGYGNPFCSVAKKLL